jgi:hypothetical protein
MFKVLILCASLNMSKVFYLPTQVAANQQVQSEFVGHPEVYPPAKCSVSVSDATAEVAAADAKAAADKTASDQRAVLLNQAKTLVTTLQASSDPKDKFLLYLLREKLNQ